MDDNATGAALPGVRAWIEERCAMSPQFRIEAMKAYDDYSLWLETCVPRRANWGQKVFGRAIRKLGIPTMKSGRRIYLGISLKS